MEAVRTIIIGETAAHWRPIFAKADCCVTIVSTLEEALADPHFTERGLFGRNVKLPDGNTFPAVPLPLAPQFRTGEKTQPFPALPKSR
jgi:crotonobetainyl-CoA:carnitine CoA-transferase CaiB-like acyl-CoA transferase